MGSFRYERVSGRSSEGCACIEPRASSNHGGEQAGLRCHSLRAGVQQQKAARAVRVLGLHRPAALPQHRRLLVPQTACTLKNRVRLPDI